VALTFDDGPHPRYTPELLDTLARHGVRATFFVVGRQADRYPDLVRRIAREGHDLANHSYLHADITLMPSREIAIQVRRTQELLRRLGGRVLSCYRPPRGKLRAWKLVRLWAMGMRVVLWQVDPRDYAPDARAVMPEWFRRRPLQPGDVVLFHDRLPHAAEVLPELIEATRRRGLSFVPLSEWTR
jgi:peptidoglycan-N-acetylglucosamine deacetylase